MTDSQTSPSELRALLSGGDRRSIGQVDQVVAMVEAQPGLLGQLISEMTYADPLIRMRSADAVEKLTIAHPDWLLPYKAELLGPVADIEQQEVQWHLAEMLPRLPLTGADLQRAWDVLQRNFEFSRSKIVRVFSLQAMFDLSAQDPELRATVVEICQIVKDDPAPSMRSRARALLKKSAR